MFDQQPDVPPAVFLLVVEVVAKGADDHSDRRRRLKDLLPESRAQSEVYEAACLGQERPLASPSKFDVYLDGALNLFHRDVGCRAFECRIAAAERLARSVGLLADTIWLTDYLTERFCRFGRVTNQKLDEVLTVLLPLILAGIVKFRSPWVPVCSSCMAHFNAQVDEISEALAREFAAEFAFEPLVGREGYDLHTGGLYEPPMMLRTLPGKKGSDGRRLPTEWRFRPCARLSTRLCGSGERRP